MLDERQLFYICTRIRIHTRTAHTHVLYTRVCICMDFSISVNRSFFTFHIGMWHHSFFLQQNLGIKSANSTLSSLLLNYLFAIFFLSLVYCRANRGPFIFVKIEIQSELQLFNFYQLLNCCCIDSNECCLCIRMLVERQTHVLKSI